MHFGARGLVANEHLLFISPVCRLTHLPPIGTSELIAIGPRTSTRRPTTRAASCNNETFFQSRSRFLLLGQPTQKDFCHWPYSNTRNCKKKTSSPLADGATTSGIGSYSWSFSLALRIILRNARSFPVRKKMPLSSSSPAPAK